MVPRFLDVVVICARFETEAVLWPAIKVVNHLLGILAETAESLKAESKPPLPRAPPYSEPLANWDPSTSENVPGNSVD